jgi:hypothetical protein|tara:strand:+ start:359 stop:526 length:168 start_codon:yes stop_codon:yes gene_type:complete
MNSYDNWKLQTPDYRDNDDGEENECQYCGEPCSDTFCSAACMNAEHNELFYDDDK